MLSPKNTSRFAAAFVACAGTLVLVGWAADIDALKSVLPIWVAMKFNTALSFLLAGLSLWWQSGEKPKGWRVRTARACAGVVGAAGAVTLSQYIFGLDLGIDQFLFQEPTGAVATVHLGRMAPLTALNFTLLGAALFGVGSRRGAAVAAAQGFAAVVVLGAILGTAGYLYDVERLYRLGPYTPIAIHTAVAFLVLALGVLGLRPDRGPASAALSAVRAAAGDRVGTLGVAACLLVCGFLGLASYRNTVRLSGVVEGAIESIRNPPPAGERDFQEEQYAQLRMSVRRTGTTMVLAGFLGSTVLLVVFYMLRRVQEEADRQAGLLKSVLDSLGEGVVVADESGKFLVWNPSAERIIGLGAADIAPSEWSAHYGVYLPDKTTPYPPEDLPLTRALRGESVDADEQFIRHAKAPQGLSLSVTGRPLMDGEGVRRGGVVVFGDITPRKRSEEEIRRLNEELKRHAASLEAANDELEAFSYSVSHDLRAPLRAMDGFSQALLEDYGGKLDETGRDYLSRVRAATRRMGDLIDDLLTLSRVSRAELKRETVDVTRLAREILEDLRREEPARRVEAAVAPGLTVEADPKLITVVLQNLLDNAWKYTGKKPAARVEVGAAPEGTGPAAFFVRDDGAGFDMAHAGKLFSAFQRLHAAEEFPGNGVGLATVQRIVHRHGGRVWAEGAVDAGATFYFTLSRL